jgi:hypothetical protein
MKSFTFTLTLENVDLSDKQDLERLREAGFSEAKLSGRGDEWKLRVKWAGVNREHAESTALQRIAGCFAGVRVRVCAHR